MSGWYQHGFLLKQAPHLFLVHVLWYLVLRQSFIFISLQSDSLDLDLP